MVLGVASAKKTRSDGRFRNTIKEKKTLKLIKGILKWPISISDNL